MDLIVRNNLLKKDSKDHSPKMKKAADQLKEQEERELRERKEYDDNMKLVASGRLKDIWYNDEVYFVSPDKVCRVDGTHVVDITAGITVKWCNSKNKWVKV